MCPGLPFTTYEFSFMKMNTCSLFAVTTTACVPACCLRRRRVRSHCCVGCKFTTSDAVSATNTVYSKTWLETHQQVAIKTTCLLNTEVCCTPLAQVLLQDVASLTLSGGQTAAVCDEAPFGLHAAVGKVTAGDAESDAGQQSAASGSCPCKRAVKDLVSPEAAVLPSTALLQLEDCSSCSRTVMDVARRLYSTPARSANRDTAGGTGAGQQGAASMIGTPIWAHQGRCPQVMCLLPEAAPCWHGADQRLYLLLCLTELALELCAEGHACPQAASLHISKVGQ